MVPIEHAIALSAVLFGIGLVGAIVRRNVIAVLICIELMLGATHLAFVSFNRLWAQTPAGEVRLDGQVFALMIMAVAAAQLSVGLGIVISLVRNRDSLNLEDASVLKW